MVSHLPLRKGSQKTQDTIGKIGPGGIGECWVQSSGEVDLSGKKATGRGGTNPYCLIEGDEGESTDHGHRRETSLEEGVHLQRSVKIPSFSKRVKEVAELLDNKDKCIDVLKEQV